MMVADKLELLQYIGPGIVHDDGKSDTTARRKTGAS